MKKKFYLAAAVLLLATNTASYFVGSAKADRYYQDAAHMSDAIRCYLDNLDDEESIIEDYGAFEEILGIYLWDDCIADPIVKLEDYVF